MTIPTPTFVSPPLGARLERLKLRHLQILDQIERSGSLSEAARQLGLSQPGATKLLRELEDALGHGLVTRSTRGVSLAPAGLIALERLRVALGSITALRDSLQHSLHRPLVRLGILPLVGIVALGRVIAQLEGQGGLPRLSVRTGTVRQLLEMLVHGEVDAVVGHLSSDGLPDPKPPLDTRPLWSSRLVAVGAKQHPLASQRSVPWTAAGEYNWILLPHGSASRQIFELAFTQQGLTPPGALVETDSFHISMNIAARSQMLTLVPHDAYWQQRSRLSSIQFASPLPSSTIFWITLKHIPVLPATTAVAQAFALYAQQYADAIAE